MGIGRAGLAAAAAAALLWAAEARAEPYIAVRTGYKCLACHVNATGGGKRTEFGNLYARTQLSARHLDLTNWNPLAGKKAASAAEGDDGGYGAAEPVDGDLLGRLEETARGASRVGAGALDLWNGAVNDYFSVGGDLRTNVAYSFIPNQRDEFDFNLEEVLLYAQLDLIPSFLTLYVDERVAPGGATNREAWGMLHLFDKRLYLKGGRIFLPYGWRLQDDDAFIRSVPGINYNTPDDGVELGVDYGPFTFQAAFTNGTAGGGEIDRGKQYTLRAGVVQPRWQAGGSWSFNDAGGGERMSQNVFVGFQTGRITWIAEGDLVIDQGTPTGRRRLWAVLGEANILITKGHNLKLTYEWFDPDDDFTGNQRMRFSAVMEVFPFQYTQFRIGYRYNDGIEQNDLQNTQDVFVELHAYF